MTLVNFQTGEIIDDHDDLTAGIRIADVVIGDRARKNYGDLTSLMCSIREHGLLQPIGVLPGNRLLFGGRRLEACRRLGWDSIPYTRPKTRDDAVSLLQAERDENVCRKEMTVSELVEIGRRLEEMERPKARERQGVRHDLTSGARAPEVPTTTADAVGSALGMSGTAYKRAKQVLDAVTDPDPDVASVAAEAAMEMERTGSIRPAADKVRNARAKGADPRPTVRVAAEDRVQQIQDLAEKGATSAHIAKELGLVEEHVRRLASRHGVTIRADQVRGRRRRIDPNRVLDNVVTSLETAAFSLRDLDVHQLDGEEAMERLDSLTTSINALTKAVKRIKESLHE